MLRRAAQSPRRGLAIQMAVLTMVGLLALLLGFSNKERNTGPPSRPIPIPTTVARPTDVIPTDARTTALRQEKSMAPLDTAQPGEQLPVLDGSSTCKDVVSWLPAKSGPTVLLQVVNKEYLRMQANFLLLMKKNSAWSKEDLFLLCLDKESVSQMATMFGIRCAEVSGVVSTKKDKAHGTRRNHQIWNFRSMVLVCLVEGGRNVLMSDNDALWLKDPLPDLQDVPGDVLIQRGHWPPEYGDTTYGVTMCMGFALFRTGGKGMSTFLRVMQRVITKIGDDQIGVNLAAQRLDIRWEYHTHSDMRYTNSSDIGIAHIHGVRGSFQVTYLPHSKYTRDCEATPITKDTVIAHCFPRYDRETAIKKADLWVLGSSDSDDSVKKY